MPVWEAGVRYSAQIYVALPVLRFAMLMIWASAIVPSFDGNFLGATFHTGSGPGTSSRTGLNLRRFEIETLRMIGTLWEGVRQLSILTEETSSSRNSATIIATTISPRVGMFFPWSAPAR
jgi:hypothetical protein